MITAVEELLQLAECDGDQPAPIVSGRMNVERIYWMGKPMSEQLRALGETSDNLGSFSSDGTPHWRADEGFIERAKSVAIAFPRSVTD